MIRALLAVLTALVLMTAPGAARAGSDEPSPAPAAAPKRPPVAPRISVLTFGPGAHPFSKFGHDAIRVRSGRGDRDLVYNFGTFRFDSPWLIVDFLQGRFKYWLSVEPYARTVERYREANRTINEQRLRLTPSQARQLGEALALNARPDRREYLYDYYRDNCATRVRDALDDVLGGALRAQMTEGAGATYRSHTLRLTRDGLLLNLGLDLALNDLTDQPITRWQEAFLPAELAESLRQISVERSGRRVPLVSHEAIVFAGDAGSARASTPPPLTFGLAGIALGLAVAALGALGARQGRAARAAAWLALALLGALGVFGWLLVLLWMTNHDFAWANENILLFAPWTVLAPVLVLLAARGARRAASWLRAMFSSAAACAALAALLKLLPAFDQENARFILLMLPIWIGATAASVAMTRPTWRGASPRPMSNSDSESPIHARRAHGSGADHEPLSSKRPPGAGLVHRHDPEATG